MDSLFDDVGMTPPSGYGITVVSAANQTVCFHVFPFFVFLVYLFVLSFQQYASYSTRHASMKLKTAKMSTTPGNNKSRPDAK